MSGSPARDVIERSVLEQSNYLSPVLTNRPGICAACFGAVQPSKGLCNNCVEGRRISGNLLADLVTPITYRIGHQGQAAHDLRAYKAARPSHEAQLRLTCLFWDFCRRHMLCVKHRMGISHFTHVSFVPSTKTSTAAHPLQTMLSRMIPLEPAPLRLNPSVDPTLRSMHTDWFMADPVVCDDGRRSPAVLLIEDTWVSGARAQSAAHSLKKAGAEQVAVISLARQLNPDYGPAKPIIKALESCTYDPERCVWH